MIAGLVIVALAVGYIAGKVDAILRVQKMLNRSTPEQRDAFREMAKSA